MKLQVVLRMAPNAAPIKKTVEVDFVRIGRNASSEIHLPDRRIPLEQGMLVFREGLFYLEGEAGDLGKSAARRTVRSVPLEPGHAIDIGPYRIQGLAPPAGFDAAVSVELVRPAQIARDLASRTANRTLASLHFSKRWASWMLVLVVLIAFLAIPAGRVFDLPWKRMAQASAIGDRFWNAGPLMLAHQPIEARCDSCHQVAFQHVKDGACLECHAKTGHHVGPELAPATLFEGARCTSCHREHKGAKSTHRDDDRACVDCHRDIHVRAQAAKSSNVSDFARDHPPFRITLRTQAGLQRVRQGDAPMAEVSTLRFPHATHLDPRGVKSPLKGRVKLECASCHKPDASRRGFEPVAMAKHCQECHDLKFEPAVTTREVPHGKAADAVTVIEEFYANLALKGAPDSFRKAFGVPGEGLLRRVGEPSAGERESALTLATRKSRKVAAELFETRVCKTCHMGIVRSGTGSDGGPTDWKIEPVRTSHSWMPRAEFDHRAHAQAPCSDCHASAKSKKAEDVSMPAIGACRECHGGSRPVQGKVTSNCLLCHAFHDARFPWDPAFKPKEPKRVAAH